MNVLMVNKFLYPRGGAETYVLQIGRYLEKQGHNVQYFGMHDSRNEVGNSLGLETDPMDFRSKGAARFLYPFRILYSVEAKKKIRRVIQQFKPDVVHLNNINFHLTPSVIDAAAELGVPMVQTVHDFQMICPNHMMLDLNRKAPCDRCVNGSKWNCARYKCIHGSRIKSILGSMEGVLYHSRRTYDKVNRYICPSRFMEQMLLRDARYAGKTAALHNFIQPEKGTAQKGDYVLYFGRLSEEKGIDRFLDACRLLPDIPFVVAGSGPLEYLLRENCPTNVRFVGFQNGGALRSLIEQAQFSVYLPIWYENCPLAVLESQSLGTPVLANRIGGIPELIQDGKTGVLLDEFTPVSYAAQIGALYHDKKRLARMAENCAKRDDFMTLDVYGRRLLKIYQSAAEGDGRQ